MVKVYDDLLFPTDGSEASKRTFPHAVRHARAFDARIHVLYVAGAARAEADGGEAETLRLTAEATLREFEERLLDEGVEVVPRTADGDPHAAIGRCSEEGIDMIVMGPCGRGGAQSDSPGLVEAVVRTVEVPVFAVHPSAVRPDEEP